MNHAPEHTIRRLAALALALALVMAQGLGLAQMPGMGLTLHADATLPDGTALAYEAMPVSYPGYEDAFWLYLPPEVFAAQSAALRVDDPMGYYPGGFRFEDGTPVTGSPLDALYALDAGDELTGEGVPFYGLGIQGEALAGFRLFVSLSAPTPMPPQEDIPPAEITIEYRDEQWNEISNSTRRTLEAGTHEVKAQPDNLPQGYELIGPDAQSVYVDRNGANPPVVTFTYRAPQPTQAPTEEPVQPALVTVEYRDEMGNPVAASSEQWLDAGEQTVYAQPDNLPQGYELIGPDAQGVYVDRNGANPPVVTFTYRAPQPTQAPTQEPVQDALVTVEYRDELGNQVAPSVQQMLSPGSNDIYAQPEGLPDGYKLIGPDMQTAFVDAGGAVPAVITFWYRAPQATPAPTEEPISPAEIQVLYLDEGGNPVADPQILTVPAGVTEVRPNPAGLLPGYSLLQPQTQAVTVDKNGASPAQVVFYYRQETAQSGPVDIIISYVDAQGNRVASDTMFRAYDGQNPVSPAPTDLLAGYTLAAGEEVKYVSVRDNAATPQSLTFVYEAALGPTTTLPPAPKVALVSVLYISESGDLLYSETVPAREGEETVIQADLSRVNAAVYALYGPGSVTVTVDAQGRPSQAEARFTFRDVTVRTATVTLRYMDELGNQLSPSQSVSVAIGSTLISASPETLPQGYELVSQNPVAVSLSDSGVLSHAEVVFTYRAAVVTPEIVTPSPVPSPIPYDVTAMERWGYPTGDAINFRSAPSVGDNANVIGQLDRRTIVHILGTIKNPQGETWYLAEAGGRQGFLRENVVRLMTYDETAAYFGWTPSPSPLPIPAEDAPRDGEAIDRWAEVTDPKGVNFRAQASASSTKISSLRRGERLWVYSQQTIGEEVWYSAMANGRSGYLRADFTRLYSREESQQYQAQLASPMPTAAQSVVTQVPPVVADSPVITPAPDLSTQTPPPSSYHGYALTIRQASLRTGASQVDEPVLEILDVNSLVYVWGQTFIGSEGWSNVEVMADSAYGYLPNASLRYIDDQEAAVYLALLRPQATQTPPPTALPTQRTGYAITLGENVPVRAFADTNAQIISLLPDRSVVAVRGQEYTSAVAWHLIQYADVYGFVRADQVRMLSAAEQEAYLQSLRTPTPAPAATLPPVTLNSPSSYGYVNTDRVRLRSSPSINSQELKLMGKHAFALVYGTSQQQDGTWYHISQGGSVGYVSGNYFTVLPMGELSTYLQSPEYLSANSDSIPVTGGYQQPTRITPVEDFNAAVWQNPTLVNPSYEPFNPLGTPTPPVEAIFTPTPSPTPLPLFISPSVEGFDDPPEDTKSSFPTSLLAVGIAALLGGGGYYGYYLYRQNQKRAAERMAQRRAQSPAGAPQARPAQPSASPYAPPRPNQGKAPYRTGVAQPPQQGQVPQGTAPYRPGMTTPPRPGQVPPGTAQYRPGSYTPPQPGQVPPGTAQYRPDNFAPPTQGAAQPRPQASAPSPPAQTPPQQPTQIVSGEVRRRRTDRHGNA